MFVPMNYIVQSIRKEETRVRDECACLARPRSWLHQERLST
jgi:hypothetical protein